MYAIYKYNAGATLAQIGADVILLLTGTTDVQTLSASCDKALSSVTTAVRVAGWTVFDAAAATNRQVLRAASFDAASAYKYVAIDYNAAGYLKMTTYETFNSGTHTGTNEASGSLLSNTQYHPQINVTVGGYLYISASARHLAIQSLQNGVIGCSTGNAPYVVSEFTRWTPWDTPANGYPNWVCVPGGNSGASQYGIGGLSNTSGYVNGNIPRFKNSTGVEVTGAAAGVSLSAPFQGSASPALGTVAKILDANLTFIVPLFPIIAAQSGIGYFGGNLSEQSDIWYTPPAAGSQNDEIVFNGNTYVIWQASSNNSNVVSTRIALRKG